MNVEDLRRALATAGIPPDRHRILDRPADDAWCLTRTKQAWKVFYRHRGQTFYPRRFKDESAACHHLYDQLARPADGTAAGLRAALLRRGASPCDFRVMEQPGESTWCIRRQGQVWQVFFFERGGKRDLRRFTDEVIACDHLSAQLFGG
ncbi:hypothetical protein [Nonomuraea sp. NPDC049709]|uniref:hypothetical protein n=1 Tax=Nonomuraea sp. NPDC049709 TaxID=3154736 RepID=UPI00341D64C5